MTKSSSAFQRDILSTMFKALLMLVLLSGCDSMTTSDPVTTGFTITGSDPYDLLGGSVRTAGDINNDGYEDIIVGAGNNNGHFGAAYVIYGGPKSSLSDIDLGSTTLDPATTGFTIRGNNGGDNLGSTVSTAGDINNDGYDDLLIGATNNYHGTVYVIYGGPKSSMSNIDLRQTILDPLTTGFMIKGNASSDFFGQAVSKAGDINQDGYGDIIIGAFGKNNLTGAAYVIYGGPKSSSSNIDLSSTALDPATTGFMITGSAAGNYFGSSLSGAGDINHDGYDDIIVGAGMKNGLTGAAYVVYGAPKTSSSNIDLSLTTLDPATTGFMISGNALLDSFGFSVSTAGDINNDGYDDIIVGAYMKNGFFGAAYVIYGGSKSSSSNIDLSSTTLDPATTGFMVSGNAFNDRFGWSVSTAGDINHDGYDDIIVGASEKSYSKGAAYVIYGGPRSLMSNIDLKTSILDPATTGFILTGNKDGDYFGYSVSTAGDINNDGFKDLIVGAPWVSGKGAAYVVYGGPKPSMTNPALHF